MSTIQKHTICTPYTFEKCRSKLLLLQPPIHMHEKPSYICSDSFLNAILAAAREPDFKINAEIWGFPSLKCGAKKLGWFITSQLKCEYLLKKHTTDKQKTEEWSYILLKFGEC